MSVAVVALPRALVQEVCGINRVVLEKRRQRQQKRPGGDEAAVFAGAVNSITL